MAAVDQAEDPVDWFLLNAEANIEVDLTAVDALEELRRILGERGIIFAMARVKKELRDLLVSCGFVEKVGEQWIFMTLPTAVDAYLDWYVDRHGSTPPGLIRPPR